MQALVWIVRFVVLLLIVWFATKNAHLVTINGVLDQKWQAPLVFVLLVAFVAGLVIGLLAWVPTVVRQRREIGRLRKTAAQLAGLPPPPVAPGTEPPPLGGSGKGAAAPPDADVRGEAAGKGARGPVHGV
jgi:uncharacterized integral membrane protein